MDNNLSLNICQWNCRGVRGKIFELEQFANNWDIFMLIETFLKPEQHSFQIRGFNTVRFDRIMGRGGGIAILVKNNLIFETIELDFNSETLEMGAISISTNRGNLAIVACYRAPGDSNNLTVGEWQRFMNAIEKCGCDLFFVGGDLNAHHEVWGSEKNCHNGNIICNLTDPEKFYIMNNGDYTYVGSPTLVKSCIDLSIISTPLALVSTWKVEPDNWRSDHFPISITIGTSAKYIPKNHFRYNLKKIDWDSFYSFWEKKKAFFCNIDFLNSQVQERYSILVNNIVDAVESSLPYKRKKTLSNDNNVGSKKNNKNKSAIWWNEKYEKAIRIKKAKWLSLQYNFSREKFLEYKKVEAQTKILLRQEKKKAFFEFCETLNRTSSAKYVFSKIKCFNNKFSKPNSYEGNKKFINNMNLCIDELCAPGVRGYMPLIEDCYSGSQEHFLDSTFDFTELMHALDNTNKKSAPGHDKINYEIIFALPEFIKRVLLDIYNDVIQNGVFPIEWKNYLCFFIPKTNSNKVRPISLAPCLLKVLEKMINERLMWWLEHNNIISNSQFGFRKNMSCIDSLALLISEIQKQFYEKNHLVAIFLDIKGAFDNVIPEILVNDLKTIGISKKIISFIYNLISERNITFTNFPGNISRSTFKGLPQGSTLSPSLFNIYVNKIEHNIGDQVKILKFADDIALYISSERIDTSIELLEQNVKKLADTLSNKNLFLAPDKCKLMIFNRANIPFNSYQFKILDTFIKPSSTTKFLGLTLDHKLNWRSHIKEIVKKCKLPINILSCVRSTWWGADPKTLLTLYKSLIRSRIEYGGFLMSPCKPKLIYELDKIQLKCLRVAMGYRLSTPVNVIIGESKIPLLEHRFELLCYKFLLKTIAKKNYTLLNTLDDIDNISNRIAYENNFDKSMLINKFKEIEFNSNLIFQTDKPICYQLEFNRILTSLNIDLCSGLEIRKAQNPINKFEELFFTNKPKNDPVFIFTDGSRIDNGKSSIVGCASWSSDVGVSFKYKLYDKASIFTAEAVAILKTLEKIELSTSTEFYIFSDSLSVLSALQNTKKLKNQNYLIQRINDYIYKCTYKAKNIRLIWIPSHLGIEGNEKADAMAKLAAKEGPLLEFDLPYADLLSSFKMKCLKNNINTITRVADELGKGSLFFRQFFSPSPKPWFYDLYLPRNAIVSINRLRSGHSSLKASLFKFSIVENDICPCGLSPENIDHITFHCKKYDRERKELYHNLYEHKLTIPSSTTEILSLRNKDLLNCFLRFIASIGLKI